MSVSKNKIIAAIGTILIVGILWLSAEAVSAYIIYKVPRAAKLFYTPPALSTARIENYFAVRDPKLGWPPTDLLGSEEFDITGSRPDPDYPATANACISLYGDSFTYGEEVTNAEAWSHQLAVQTACRVANYGAPGYGTDQAYARFIKNDFDKAPTVILGIYQENILRIVNQYRHFLSGGDELAFKPRYIVEDDRLKYIEVPITPDSNLAEILANPQLTFKYEWFLPGTSDGPAVIRFPYTLSIINALLTRRVQNGLLGKPNWLEFYSTEHPSGALPLMQRIVAAFKQEALRRGQKFKVIIFPTTTSYLYWQQTKTNSTQILVDTLAELDIDTLDLTEKIAEYSGGRDYCDYLTNINRRCSGHYNPSGNSMVSELVYRWLAADR